MKSIKELKEELPALLNDRTDPARLAAYLADLEGQCQRIDEHSNGYPNGTISGDIWADGYELVGIGARFSAALEKRGPEELWLRALSCWATAVFAVVSHYRAAVGPVMYASLRHHRRKGDEAGLREQCRAIVADFTLVLEEAEALLAEDANAFSRAEDIDGEAMAIAYLELAARELSRAGDGEAAALLARIQQLPPFWHSLKLPAPQ